MPSFIGSSPDFLFEYRFSFLSYWPSVKLTSITIHVHAKNIINSSNHSKYRDIMFDKIKSTFFFPFYSSCCF